jgi:hypothetical protein
VRRALKSVILGVTLACGVLAASEAAASPGQEGSARPMAAPRTRIEVGVQLVALRQVTIQQVTLVKGSRVRVVAIDVDPKGRPTAVSLELPDGYVLRGVSYAVVRANFRAEPPTPSR